MIESVYWQCILILPSASGSNRIARRISAGETPFYLYPPAEVDSAHPRPYPDPHSDDSNAWAMNAPDHFVYNGLTYVFAFWAVAGRDISGSNADPDTRPEFDRRVSASKDSGQWQYTMRAYYVWNFDGEGGGHYVLIDAVNESEFDTDPNNLYAGFLADDFVDVFPNDLLSDGRTRTQVANDDGDIYTSSLPQGDTFTITAYGILRGGHTPPPGGHLTFWDLKFRYWQPTQRVVGNPPEIDDHQIFVHQNDIAVVWAFYHRHQETVTTPPLDFSVLVISGQAGGPFVYLNPGRKIIHREPSGPPFGYTEKIDQAVHKLMEALHEVQKELPQKGLSEEA